MTLDVMTQKPTIDYVLHEVDGLRLLWVRNDPLELQRETAAQSLYWQLPLAFLGLSRFLYMEVSATWNSRQERPFLHERIPLHAMPGAYTCWEPFFPPRRKPYYVAEVVARDAELLEGLLDRREPGWASSLRFYLTNEKQTPATHLLLLARRIQGVEWESRDGLFARPSSPYLELVRQCSCLIDGLGEREGYRICSAYLSAEQMIEAIEIAARQVGLQVVHGSL